MAPDRDLDDLEPLEGDEGELEVGRHRDVGRACLQTPIAQVRRADAVTVPPDAPVARAVDLMRKRKASAVLVVDRTRARRLLGIFTERDLVERALPARGWARARVDRFMTRAPEALRARDSVAYGVNKMSVGGFRHVPIVDDAGRPAGILSARDVLDFVVELCPEELLNLPPEPELEVHPRAEGD
ncbi:MAG TPA: CBS domain-containing protein [Anaeromyxobacter sp.]|nr:CBS domain-containing protein [Anaeromyxobacter sp.]